MARLDEEERQDLLRLASAEAPFSRELKMPAAARHNPLLQDGRVDVDRVLAFLTEFNEMINHHPRPFKKMVEQVMKL